MAARQFPFSVGTHPQAPLYPAGGGGAAGIGGGGTIGKIPLWSGPSTLADSSISEDSGVVSIDALLSVNGEADANDFVLVGGSPGGGGTPAALFSVFDEGVLKANNVSSINFIGAGVVASAVGGDVTVEILFDQAAADARYSQLGHTHPASDISGLAGAVMGVGDARYLQLTGGELTGALLGTTADFSGEVDGADFVLIGGSSGGGASAALFSVLEEGVLKSSAVSSINFTGAGVTASAVGDAVTVAITFDQGAADARYVQLANFNTLGDARYSLLGHTHSFASLTSKPTTIGGFGITDFNSLGDARWRPLGANVILSGGTNPYVRFDDGTRISYWQMASGTMRLDHNGALRMAFPAAGGSQVYGNLNVYVADGSSNVFAALSTGSRAYTGLTVDIALVARRINMDRSGGAAGLSFYASTFSAWQMYMSDASAGQGYLGNLTAPAGSFVTSWALRSVVEPAAGYGWTWESVAATDTTPGITMELSSQTGNLRASGAIYSSSAFGWMLGNVAGYNRIYYASANGRFEFVNAADQFTQIISKTARVSDYFLSDVSHGSGMVGLYEPSHYRLIYAMGIPYNMPLDGTTLGTLYGMFFAFDNPSYKDITGRTLGHGFGLAENGVQKFFCGAQGMWHAGDATAHDFILS